VGPVTRARLAEIGVLTIGQLAQTPGWSLERLLGPAAGEKLAALAWNRDPRQIKSHRRARSHRARDGAQVGKAHADGHGSARPGLGAQPRGDAVRKVKQGRSNNPLVGRLSANR
jgi:nucleotidyltransferase/DNA polymerase involved in DNA repair